jgi:hypothetical protein
MSADMADNCVEENDISFCIEADHITVSACVNSIGQHLLAYGAAFSVNGKDGSSCGSLFVQ